MRSITLAALLSLSAFGMPVSAESGAGECEYNLLGAQCGSNGKCTVNAVDSYCDGDCTINVSGECTMEGECEVNVADDCDEYRPVLEDCTKLLDDPENFTCLYK